MWIWLAALKGAVYDSGSELHSENKHFKSCLHVVLERPDKASILTFYKLASWCSYFVDIYVYKQ